MFFEAGVKNQNLKLGPIALRFCMGLSGTNTNFFCFLDHIDLGLYLKNTAILKKKNIFSKKKLGTSFRKKIFLNAKTSYFDTHFGLLFHLTPKMTSRSF